MIIIIVIIFVFVGIAGPASYDMAAIASVNYYLLPCHGSISYGTRGPFFFFTTRLDAGPAARGERGKLGLSKSFVERANTPKRDSLFIADARVYTVDVISAHEIE